MRRVHLHFSDVTVTGCILLKEVGLAHLFEKKKEKRGRWWWPKGNILKAHCLLWLNPGQGGRVILYYCIITVIKHTLMKGAHCEIVCDAVAFFSWGESMSRLKQRHHIICIQYAIDLLAEIHKCNQLAPAPWMPSGSNASVFCSFVAPLCSSLFSLWLWEWGFQSYRYIIRIRKKCAGLTRSGGEK